MSVMARWNIFTFEIDYSKALLFDKLHMSAETETEDTTENGQKYVKTKNGKPLSVTLTAIVNAAMGADVRTTVLQMMDAAQRSTEDYLYVGYEKIFPFRLMLTKAETDDIGLIPGGGGWVSANVNLTFQQSSPERIFAPSAPAADSFGTGSDGGWQKPQSIINTMNTLLGTEALRSELMNDKKDAAVKTTALPEISPYLQAAPVQQTVNTAKQTISTVSAAKKISSGASKVSVRSKPYKTRD